MRNVLPALLVAIGLAGPAFAGEESPAAAAPQAAASGAPDFLFGAPRGSISVGGAWLVPRADSDLFRFVGDQLTVDRSDFRAPAFTAAFGMSVTPAFDVVGDFEVSGRSIGSQYRRYVKPDRSEITQTTKFNRAAIGAGVRYFPIGRGRSISRYAFVPRRISPYVGAGASLEHYTFSQAGQFVDFVDLSIFNHSFASNGWSLGPHVDVGADLQIWRMFFANIGLRYQWNHAELGPDYVGFDGIDLSGLRSSSGISVVF